MLYTLKAKETSTNRRKTARASQKPKVAVFFSGRVAAYEYSQFSLLELQRKYNATFFCSLNREAPSPYVQHFCDIFSIMSDQVSYEKAVNPEWFTPYLETPRIANLYATLYHNKRAFNLIESYMEKYNMRFDIVLFYRADLLVLTHLLELKPPQPNAVYIPVDIGLKNVEPPGINGYIAYGDVKSMKLYTSAIDHLEKYRADMGGRLYHEGVLLHHLKTLNLRMIEMPYMVSPNDRELYDCRLNPMRHDTNPEYL